LHSGKVYAAREGRQGSLDDALVVVPDKADGISYSIHYWSSNFVTMPIFVLRKNSRFIVMLYSRNWQAFNHYSSRRAAILFSWYLNLPVLMVNRLGSGLCGMDVVSTRPWNLMLL
jgi:hypothetical protein